LKKIEQFQEEVQREVNAELMDLSRLETLLDEFTSPPDIDIPELTLLKKVTASHEYASHECFSLVYFSCMQICIL